MTSLSVWHYPTPFGADAAEVRLKRLEEVGDITVHDLVTVVWPSADKRPKIGHRRGRKKDLLGGTAMGVLIGTVLGGPVVGAAVGVAAGEVRHQTRGPVIDEQVVAGLREEIRPGTSAMFVLSSGANVPAVREVLSRDRDARLLHHESDSPVAQALLDELHAEQEKQDGA
ncbi:MAG: DUF1269 domain-containing protein [Nocardioidaceae bacterium]|nr:DUF1269 domain-containing protein [Nocardioidaceae bacterium]NUS51421.1 DUF1269 domain-containing protein [Nocardioidaceae bacterium]